MATIEQKHFVGEPSEDLILAVRQAMTDVRDRELMRKAAERMDRLGAEIRQKHRVLDIGTAAIRELRGE